LVAGVTVGLWAFAVIDGSTFDTPVRVAESAANR
jgi:hypothetical protein